jgi:hypothetical protein
MNTSLIQSLINDSDYFYNQNKYTRGCGDLRSITLTFQYNRTVCLEFDKYPELIPIAEQLIKYVQESEPVKQHNIKQKLLEVLEEVK